MRGPKVKLLQAQSDSQSVTPSKGAQAEPPQQETSHWPLPEQQVKTWSTKMKTHVLPAHS